MSHQPLQFTKYIVFPTSFDLTTTYLLTHGSLLSQLLLNAECLRKSKSKRMETPTELPLLSVSISVSATAGQGVGPDCEWQMVKSVSLAVLEHIIEALQLCLSTSPASCVAYTWMLLSKTHSWICNWWENGESGICMPPPALPLMAPLHVTVFKSSNPRNKILFYNFSL